MQYIGGPEVTALESALAAYTGARYALTVSSGTDALLIALMGEGLSKEDAVFLPAFTYNATCNAILTAGAIPVFVDVDRETCNIDPESLAERLTSTLQEGRLRPRLIITVDLYGLPAPYPQILPLAQSHNLLILSDAAQSFGATQSGFRSGSLADMTAISFYPTKTLGAYGDGGALFTDDPARFQRWQSIRWHGTDPTRQEPLRVRINGRSSSMQSAIVLAKLAILPEELRARAHLAARYHMRLAGVVPCQEVGTTGDGHAYGLFTVMVERRDDVQRALKSKGIPTAVYYARPLHRRRAFANYAEGVALPNSEWLAERVLSLPFHPYLSEGQVDRVCEVLQEVMAVEGRARL
jgi:UDP-2-acetamido-2-deoxy-ribo-hexuluronate aminotransferase